MASQTPDATPRPWKVLDDDRPGIDSADPLGRNVVYAGRFTNGFGGVGTAADAALIVEAVNNYDRLRAIEAAARDVFVAEAIDYVALSALRSALQEPSR